MPAMCRVKCAPSNFISGLTEVVLAEGVIYHLVTLIEKMYVDRECKPLSGPEGRLSIICHLSRRVWTEGTFNNNINNHLLIYESSYFCTF